MTEDQTTVTITMPTQMHDESQMGPHEVRTVPSGPAKVASVAAPRESVGQHSHIDHRPTIGRLVCIANARTCGWGGRNEA